jgi:hypothetical protein
MAAFGRRLHDSTVENGGGGLRIAPFGHAGPLPQIMHNAFERACFHPVVGLVINSMPGWEIIRHHPPGHTGAEDLAQAVEDLPERVLPLQSIFGH